MHLSYFPLLAKSRVSHALLLLSLCPATAVAADILSCKDANGKTIYTDNTANCVGQAQKHDVHDSVTSGLANYRSPPRIYQSIPGEWKILVEQDMAAADPKLTAAASSRLQQALASILEKLPAASHAYVKGLNFYLMWGPKSPKGGQKGGMRAVLQFNPVNHPLYDPVWKNAVIIYSAANFVAVDEVVVRKDLSHEIGHTWHLRDWPAKHPEVTDAFQAAKLAGLYKNVETYKGKMLDTAYALTNEREYFAELTAMYFMGSTYYPYDKAGLKKYDARGYQMIEQYWGIR
ncbi:DUF4124 domain-containing protein [Undibacterium sp.]|uniref:DUF4124 domain-containing protein n=1 Tax=Undibacterium sp. TaxID=1914977 RepID=UPI00272F76A3|nr:DUF4124 domain-containing protein [Undibacterium sp.]MDP1978534.1 DUF4124 domain-containing protein [Undibacterium sp.]